MPPSSKRGMRTELYQSKCMSASDAAESIRSGETVFVSGGALTPLEIGNAMGDLVGQRTGIRVMTYLPLAASRLYTAPEGTDTFSMEAIF